MPDTMVPLTGVAFVAADGAVLHTGVLVSRDLCPGVRAMRAGCLYVLVSSTVSSAATVYRAYHFLHLQRLGVVQAQVAMAQLPGVARLELRPLPRNPWPQAANETRGELRRRRRRLAAVMSVIMREYVEDNAPEACPRRCGVLGRRKPLLWQPAVVAGQPGFMTAGPSALHAVQWGRHVFDSEITAVVYTGLGVYDHPRASV